MIKNNYISVNEYKYRKYKYKYNLTRGGAEEEEKTKEEDRVMYNPTIHRQVYWADIYNKPSNTIYFGLMFETLEKNYKSILEKLNLTQTIKNKETLSKENVSSLLSEMTEFLPKLKNLGSKRVNSAVNLRYLTLLSRSAIFNNVYDTAITIKFQDINNDIYQDVYEDNSLYAIKKGNIAAIFIDDLQPNIVPLQPK